MRHGGNRSQRQNETHRAVVAQYWREMYLPLAAEVAAPAMAGAAAANRREVIKYFSSWKKLCLVFNGMCGLKSDLVARPRDRDQAWQAQVVYMSVYATFM